MEVRRSLLVSVTVAVLVCCTGPRLAEALGASTVSLSGNAIYRACFHILALSCDVLSANVHGRTSLSTAVVTQLVTHRPVDSAPRPA